MGLYVELMCDVRTPGMRPDNPLRFICYTNENDNPMGSTPAHARAKGRIAGWKTGPGNKVICPGCLRAAHQKDQQP